jgi:hypothetical protein
MSSIGTANPVTRLRVGSSREVTPAGGPTRRLSPAADRQPMGGTRRGPAGVVGPAAGAGDNDQATAGLLVPSGQLRISAVPGASLPAPRSGTPHPPNRTNLEAALRADPNREVTVAWHCARAVYHAADIAEDHHQAEQLLPICTPIPEIARLGQALRSLRSEFLAYFDIDRISTDPPR